MADSFSLVREQRKQQLTIGVTLALGAVAAAIPNMERALLPMGSMPAALVALAQPPVLASAGFAPSSAPGRRGLVAGVPRASNFIPRTPGGATTPTTVDTSPETNGFARSDPGVAPTTGGAPVQFASNTPTNGGVFPGGGIPSAGFPNGGSSVGTPGGGGGGGSNPGGDPVTGGGTGTPPTGGGGGGGGGTTDPGTGSGTDPVTGGGGGTPTNPPGTNPPGTGPGTNPPGTNPPGTDPGANPPGTNPPGTDPGPPTAPGVPEPATWLLLIAGFGAMAMQLRRRSQRAVSSRGCPASRPSVPDRS